jgi:ribulose-bisphosphate carboxylase small chain
MFFLVQRPDYEPGFELVRAEGKGRTMQYTLRSYVTSRPQGQRYQKAGGQ